MPTSLSKTTENSSSTLDAARAKDLSDCKQYQRRFQGTKTLYGDQSFAQFEQAHIYVIGIGGVGSWAIEALARTAIGQLTLIDMDVLVASNVNRQLPALDKTFGRGKIEVMAERARQINPNITLNLIDNFLTVNNVTTLLPSRQVVNAKQGQVVILDCTDDMSAKLAIALHCRFNKLKLICAGGAGGKTDPRQVTVSDLKDTYQDPLLARLRNKLRHEHNINKALTKKFGIKCVYSTQPPASQIQSGQSQADAELIGHIKPVSKLSSNDSSNTCTIGGLHCGGYGSAVVVTSVVGMIMASEALAILR